MLTALVIEGIGGVSLGALCVQVVAAGLVADPVRRTALSLLADRQRTTRSDLAETLADHDAVAVDDVDLLEIALHHNHLPRLDDEGYVDYDPRNGDVVLWEDPDVVLEQLDAD